MYIDVNEFSEYSCDSDMIMAAIDKATITGETVIIPKINKRTGSDIWDISKTIELPDDVVIILMNCHMRLADGVVCNMFANKNARLKDSLSPENQQKNITIKGVGKVILDGGKHNNIYECNGIVRKKKEGQFYMPNLNCTMYFKNVRNLTIENVEMHNSRYWSIINTYVSHSRFSNIAFSTDGNVPNQDGLDMCSGCHDIIAENITGATGDNLIAMCSMGNPSGYCDDIYNISIKNVLGYSVNGCSLIRILNHDGRKIYNIRIDNVVDTSPWSDNDAPVAPNPDLFIRTDDDGNVLPWKRLIPGEHGYRQEATIIIGELYWFTNKKADHGDTYGISVSNVTSHSRFALWITNTLMDSSFDNIRVFGNGYSAVFFGEGDVENVRFSNISYDKTAHPLKQDEHIHIEWNNTKSDGLSCVYFNNTNLKDTSFIDMRCCDKMQSVFGGHGNGNIYCRNLTNKDNLTLNSAKGIECTLLD